MMAQLLILCWLENNSPCTKRADSVVRGPQPASTFFDSCEKKKHVNGITHKLWKTLAKAQTSFAKDHGSRLAVVKTVKDLLLQHVLYLFKQFKKWRETQSPTFAYWAMLLDTVLNPSDTKGGGGGGVADLSKGFS